MHIAVLVPDARYPHPWRPTYDLQTRALTALGVQAEPVVWTQVGDVAGFATNGAGNTEAFLLRSDGQVIHLNVPGASATQAFGVNNGDEVVGDYTVGTGNNIVTGTAGSSDSVTHAMACLVMRNKVVKPLLWQLREGPQFDTDAGTAWNPSNRPTYGTKAARSASNTDQIV